MPANPDNPSVSVRDSLEQVARQTGKRPARLDGPEPPEAFAHVWGWWCRLCREEGASYQEIRAWSELTGHIPTPPEVDAMRALNELRARIMSEGR